MKWKRKPKCGFGFGVGMLVWEMTPEIDRIAIRADNLCRWWYSTQINEAMFGPLHGGAVGITGLSALLA